VRGGPLEVEGWWVAVGRLRKEKNDDGVWVYFARGARVNLFSAIIKCTGKGRERRGKTRMKMVVRLCIYLGRSL